jgi:hypothetical protein
MAVSVAAIAVAGCSTDGGSDAAEEPPATSAPDSTAPAGDEPPATEGPEEVEGEVTVDRCVTEARTVRTAQTARFAETGAYGPNGDGVVGPYLREAPTLVIDESTETEIVLTWAPACAELPGIPEP